MKRIVALALALSFVLGMAVAPGMAADKKVVIKIAGMKPEGEPETIGMRNFGKYLTELSGGKYVVQVFPNSQLGKEDAYIAVPARASFRCAPRARRRRLCTRPWPCWKLPCCSTTSITRVGRWKAKPSN